MAAGRRRADGKRARQGGMVLMVRNQAVRHESSAARWAAARERRRRLLAAWRESGQSAAEFCRRQGLVYPTFCGWRQRAKREPAATPGSAVALRRRTKPPPAGEKPRPSQEPAPVFVPLRWTGPVPAASPTAEIGLRNGRTLRVPWGCEPETAARWAAALEA